MGPAGRAATPTIAVVSVADPPAPRRRRPSLLGRLTGLAITMGAGAVAMALCLALVANGLSRVGRSASFSPPGSFDFAVLSERSVVYDRYGRVLGVFRAAENRKAVPLSAVPKVVIDAIVSVEDADFFNHRGVNLRRTIGALSANVEAGGVEQGGSTITQQLVKQGLLTSDQNLTRKISEARLAWELEKRWTKQEILERYLNTVYFGQGAYGVEAAANHYFGVPIAKLDVAQAAFLAGMIRNPVGYDPTRFRERSRNRRAVVLRRMVTTGVLTRADADRWALAPMPRPKEVDEPLPESYFLEEVKQRLLDDPRLGPTQKDRYNAVFSGGLRIYTTFDPGLQAKAEAVVAEDVPEDSADTFTAALVSVDVATGAVRALVGGRGFETDKFNLATQARRQPGSSWKPFTLIAALEAGNSPEAVISGNEPCPIPNPDGEPDPYLPGNADGSKSFIGTLEAQLAASSNCAYARLATVIGLDEVAAVARRLGITTPIDAVPAMALGTEEVKPIDMAGAYATIANDGLLVTPYLVERVVGRGGKEVFRAPRPSRRVLESRVARLAVGAMQAVVRRGTGTAARLDRTEVAGKTGTAQNYEDAWFVGFTPSVATAVWMGAPVGKIPMRNVGGRRVTGGSYPARIWHDFMETAAARDIASEAEFPTLAEDDERGDANCLQLVAPKRSRGSTGPAQAKTSRRRTACESWGGVSVEAKKATVDTVPVEGDPQTEVSVDSAPPVLPSGSGDGTGAGAGSSGDAPAPVPVGAPVG
jgi:1A family penicillin-binding protein